MKIYLAGCGKLGRRLGQELMLDGDTVIGLKRSDEKMTFPVVSIDLEDKASTEQLELDADIVIFTVTPNSYDKFGYQNVYNKALSNVIDWIQKHPTPPLLVMVSSTGVYGQNQGEWVNENSPTTPTKFSGKWVLFGEEQVKRRLKSHLIIRFSGIYSHQRNWLINRSTGNIEIQKTPCIWTNRIHEDDCIGVLYFLISQYRKGTFLDSIYLASDDLPVSQYDISAFICNQLNQAEPTIKTHNLTNQYNKRCCNEKLKTLGYTFKYPNYQVGYGEILKTTTFNS